MSPETQAAAAALDDVNRPIGPIITRTMDGLLLARAVLALERIAAVLEHGRDAAEARDD